MGGIRGDGAQLGVEERGAGDGRRPRPDQRQRASSNPTELIKLFCSFSFFTQNRKKQFLVSFLFYYVLTKHLGSVLSSLVSKFLLIVSIEPFFVKGC